MRALRTKRRTGTKTALVLAAIAATPLVAHADKTWKAAVTSGGWTVPSNWNEGAIPLNTDNVFIVHADATSRSISYVGSYSSNLRLDVDNSGSGTNTLAISAGFSLTLGTENIGLNGRGVFNQSAGTHTVTDTMVLGSNPSAVGSYNLSANGNLVFSGTSGSSKILRIGWNGTGLFTQSGGTMSMAPTTSMQIGDFPGSAGSYNMSAGVLSARSMLVGNTGAATFSQSGGTSSFTAVGFPAVNVGANGAVFSISGAASSVVTGEMDVGNTLGGGVGGTLSVSNGTLSVSGALQVLNVGAAAPAGTRVDLSGGWLSVGSLSTSGSPSRFNWTGGTLAVTNSPLWFQGDGPLGTSITLSSGKALSVTQEEWVGAAGFGTFVQTGGTHTLNDKFIVGANFGGGGAYQLSGGAIQNLGGGEFIGYGGAGTFTQSGGTNTVTTTLILAQDAGGSGRYDLTSGTLNAGNVALATTALTVGNSGSGTMTQSGGTVSILSTNGGLVVGFSSGGDGLYYLSGGSLNSQAALGEVIGNAGAGAFIHTGGTNTVGTSLANANLTIGFSVGGSGSYNLSGNGVAAINGSVAVGGTGAAARGTGALYVSGGTMTVSSALKVWDTPGTVFSLSGGMVTAGSIDLSGNTSRFNWTGGTLNLPTAAITTDMLATTLNMTAGKTLTVGQSITNNDTIAMSGGMISGSTGVINNGLLSGYGTIMGHNGIVNTGAISVDSGHLSLTNSGAVTNSGTINLAAGYQLKALGGDVSNSGTINLNGGAITGGVTLTNQSAGVISGPGTIGTSFANSGALIVPNGNTSVPSFVNSGLIEVDGTAANLSGGLITNLSTIQGHGKITSSIINSGTIEATGGTLILTSAVIMNGTLAASAGNKVLMQSPTFNSAAIALTGGTLDTNNLVLTNLGSGVISGRGTIRTGGITNGGQIQLSAGLTDVYGSLTGSSGSKVIVSGGGTSTFYSNVTMNSGSEFRVSTGSTAVFFGNVSGTDFFTGSGTTIFEDGSSSVGSMMMPAGKAVVELPADVTASRFLLDELRISGRASVAASGADSGVSAVNTLAIETGGTLDLADNDLIVNNGVFSEIFSHVIAGFGNTSGGITSSTSDGSQILALFDNALVGATDWAGQSIGPSAIVGKYTYFGDANIDGQVTGDDYTVIDANLNTAPAVGLGWLSGDLNLDGIVSGDDYTVIDANLGLGSGNPLTPNQWTPVPEPTALALIAAGLLSARRRRHD